MQTLPEALGRAEGSRPALVVPGGPALSHEQLRREVARGAEALAALGIGRGDRVATVLPNGAEAVVLFLAAAQAGAAAPLNPGYKEDELRFYLRDTRARALVVPPGGGEAARRARPEGVLLVEAWIEGDGRLRLEGQGPSRARTPGEPAPDDVALVLHTSGTTSRPKIVPLRQRNLAASIENIVGTYRLTPDDVSLCVMPLFHVHGLLASALSALAAGGTVVVPPRFAPLRFWPLVREHAVTWYSAVPTIHQLLLLRAGQRGPRAAASLRFVRSCSAALTPETMERLESAFGVPVLEAYGMTEAAHQMASNPLPPEQRRPGTVGRGTGVRIGVMDKAGRLLAAGEAGEVVIQGPNVIDGYEGNPEANASSFTSGWFRTGDQGVLDEDGYLRLVGRLKEMINRGGEKIAPREIDEVLMQHPAVAEAVAFAVPHETWGEEVAAAVVLREPVSEKELLSHCRERLAEFKVPKVLRVVDELPRTPTGKIQRRAVAEALRDP